MIGTTMDAAMLCDAVHLACRAPSLHNSQPWRWIAHGSTLHLYADLNRSMTAADPLGREVYLSCGAVLDHLVAAMSAAGWETEVTRFPDPHAPLHVAAIQFSPASQPPSPAARARADAIPRRRTDRRAFGAPPQWADLQVRLRQTVIPYHVMFDVVLDDARPQLAEASQLTEAIRRSDPTYAAELAWWTASQPSATGSAGVDVARTFPDSAQGPQAPADVHDQSKIIVLSTSHEDARHEVLRCGEALSAVLLECTAAGLATCTLTHMTELAQSREIIRRLTGQAGAPQVLVRIGRATPQDDAVTTARRPVSEVLEFRRPRA